MVRRD